jgi:hypothetical protein
MSYPTCLTSNLDSYRRVPSLPNTTGNFCTPNHPTSNASFKIVQFFPFDLTVMWNRSAPDRDSDRHPKLTFCRYRSVPHPSMDPSAVYFTILHGRVVVCQPAHPDSTYTAEPPGRLPTQAVKPDPSGSTNPKGYQTISAVRSRDAKTQPAQSLVEHPDPVPAGNHNSHLSIHSDRFRRQPQVIQHVRWADPIQQCEPPTCQASIMRIPTAPGQPTNRGVTPSFSLQFQFRGVPYQVAFPVVENPGDLLRRFERRIRWSVSQDRQDQIGDALLNGYTLRGNGQMQRDVRGNEQMQRDVRGHGPHERFCR